MGKKFMGLLLLFAIVLAAERSMVEVEGKTCSKPSKYYKGYCGFDKGCAQTCQRENWPGGKCVPNGPLAYACSCKRPC